MSATAVTQILAASDEVLLARIGERELDALDQLYGRYSRQAFALAYRMLASREAAEEVVQDAFFSIWRQAATYRATTGRVRPWLFSIVHHRGIDHIRRERPAAATLDEAWMRPSAADVFADVYGGLRRERIRWALAELPVEQKQAVDLAYFGGNTFAEIAEMTCVPVGTVKSRVRLALAKLKALLDGEIDG